MVGTAVYQVGASSSSHSKNRNWWKPGVHATVPPPASDASRAATRPWMWNSGMTLRHRSVGSSPRASATFRAERQSLPCVRGTSLGRDVVPDVCRRSATSAGSGETASAARSSRPPRLKTPAGQAGSTRSSMTVDSTFLGDRAGGRVERRSDHQRLGADVVERKRELAFAVGRVQRRDGSGLRDREECGRRLGPVVDYECDPASRSEPVGPQRPGGREDEVPEAVVRQGITARGAQRRSPRRSCARVLDQIADPPHRT